MIKGMLKGALTGAMTLLLTSPLYATVQVTVDTGQTTVNYTGQVIVREGGQGRIPITIVGEQKLFQFYEHENKVQRIRSEEATLVGEAVTVHDSPSADAAVVTSYLRGLEVTRLGNPNAEGWINVRGLTDQNGTPITGWIPADVLVDEVTFGPEDTTGTATEATEAEEDIAGATETESAE